MKKILLNCYIVILLTGLLLAIVPNAMAKDDNVGRYALIEQATGKVVNVILLDPSSGWTAPAGHIVIRSGKAGPGDVWDGKGFKKQDPKETPTPTPIQSNDLSVGNLDRRISLLEIKLDKNGNIITSPPPASPAGGPSSQGGGSFLTSVKTALETLGVRIQDSVLQVRRIITKQLAIEQSASNTAENTTGEGIILAGATSTTIQAPVIGVYDKVFVTFRTLPKQSWAIVEQTAGEGFVVGLEREAGEDLYFDWWVVGVQMVPPSPEDTEGQSNDQTPMTNEIPSPNDQNATTTEAVPGFTIPQDTTSGAVAGYSTTTEDTVSTSTTPISITTNSTTTTGVL